jgi:hypothetical protein
LRNSRWWGYKYGKGKGKLKMFLPLLPVTFYLYVFQSFGKVSKIDGIRDIKHASFAGKENMD